MKQNDELQNSRLAERPVQRFYQKDFSWSLLEREMQTRQSQKMTSELSAAAYVLGLRANGLCTVSSPSTSDSLAMEIGSFAHDPASRQWFITNSHTCAYSWLSIREEFSLSLSKDPRPFEVKNEEPHNSKVLIWEDKIVILMEREIYIGNLVVLAHPEHDSGTYHRVGGYGDRDVRDSGNFIDFFPR